MGTYTEQMEDILFAGYGNLDDDDSSAKTVDFLNSSEGFRSFGDGLLLFINKVDNSITAESAYKYISSCCKEKGMDINDIATPNTIKSWFNTDKRPRKREQSREDMFALAFALGLSVKETSQLFHKVYLDRAFDLRNVHELVYYYGLANGCSWSKTKQLITEADSISGDGKDVTVYTSRIKSDADKLETDEDLLEYINNHQHNFSKKNTAAEMNANKMLSEAKEIARKEAALPEHEGQFEGRWSHGEEISNNFLYEIITDYSPSGRTGTKSAFKNSRLPDEIKTCFPEAASLSDKSPSYEALRKRIIFLASYIFWFNMQWESGAADFEDYCDYMNNLLLESGMPELYYGNPFDWLFLYCTLSDRPLDTFRDILYEVNNKE